jgi:hypothetical protein
MDPEQPPELPPNSGGSRRPSIGNAHHIYVSLTLEELGARLRDRSIACGGEIDLSRICLAKAINSATVWPEMTDVRP